MMERRGRASPPRGPEAWPLDEGGLEWRRPWLVRHTKDNSRTRESGLGKPRQVLDMTTISEPLITEGEAAAMLRVSLTSLRRWRRNGCSPVFRKIGRTVRYRPADLAEFVSSARRTSTAGANRETAR